MTFLRVILTAGLLFATTDDVVSATADTGPAAGPHGFDFEFGTWRVHHRIKRAADGGDTFAPFMAGLPLGMVVTDLEIVAEPHSLVAGTYGRGAWKALLEAPITDRIFADGFDTVL